MRVLVIGGGLGGLCLAQGLRRHGVDVAVFERDADADTRRQGYRLHLDSRAASALRECLPPDRYARFQAITGAVRASLKAARGPAWLPAFLAVRRFFARR